MIANNLRPFFRLSALLFAIAVFRSPGLAGQVPTQPLPLPGGQLPNPAVAEQLLKSRPDLVEQLKQRIGASGLSKEQIRARLRAAGYPENFLDPYLSGADTTQRVTANSDVVEAVRVLGIVGGDEVDSLLVLTDSAQHLADSLRADSLSDTSTVLRVFGMSVFRRTSSLFNPALSGPVDPNYRLGPGDQLVLILSGDVELAHELVVTREGFISIPQVGQLYVANLTLGQLEDLLYNRLGRVYSGVRRGANPTTRFNVTVSKLRTVQIYVTGDVMRPGSYQVSAAGTAMSALYAAGGPSINGSFRRVEIRRAGKLVDSLDLYDYLLRGDNSHDARLETGDVVFVPVRSTHVKVTGSVIRPAIYELKDSETLRDLLQAAGGFEAAALRRRVQIDRILPPAQRQPGGRDRVVLDVASDQFTDGLGPPMPMAPGDSVTVLQVAERRRDLVRVTGNVWTPGLIGLTPDMKLSQAIRLAGGPKPDVYLSQILVSRLLADSTRIQLRSAFSDSAGGVTEDLPLKEDDEITVFSRSNFRPLRYVALTGAVRKPGRIPYRDGMTLRDALLAADGLTEDAYLTEAEIARLPDDSVRGAGRVASTQRVPLDSTYVFDRDADGRYLGPPGKAALPSGAPEIKLEPYDNILFFRQPEWEFQRTVTLTGMVRFPGRYALVTRKDRLLDLIQRAGGLTKEAYPEGLRFFRSSDRGGRIGVDLAKVIHDPKYRDNLILSGGDSIFVPEYIPVIYVNGAVNAPMSVTWVRGKGMDYYVASAGGYTRKADKGRAYVTQASGKVESVNTHFWFFPDYKPEPRPGAAIYVPERDPADKRDWLVTVSALAQIIASLATTVLVIQNTK